MYSYAPGEGSKAPQASVPIGAPSLVRTAQRVAAKHVESIQGFADTPLHLIRPILAGVRSPEHLKLLEEGSPQIVGPDTEKLWKSFIARDIPNGDRNELEPKNPASWWKVYRKLKRDDEHKQRIAEQQLRASLGMHEAARESNKATFVACVLPAQRKTGGRMTKGRTTAISPVSTIRNNDQGHRRITGTSSDLQFRGTVTQAPTHMVNQYLRANNKAPLPTTRTIAPLRKVRTPYNPFKHAKKVVPTLDQQALARALHFEKDKQAKEERVTGKASRPAQGRPSAPNTSTTSTVHPKPAAGRPGGSAESRKETASPAKRQPPAASHLHESKASPAGLARRTIISHPETEMPRIKPLATPTAGTATTDFSQHHRTIPVTAVASLPPPKHTQSTQQGTKRKAPNIFMPAKRVRN